MSITCPDTVYLVGAGPGNPDLLTKKVERLIRSADMTLFDRLISPFILQYASSRTKVISVGKRPHYKHIQQEEISQEIVGAANQYQCVVRLEGGDPAIFGRITEGIQTLEDHYIRYKIVPGVTSASVAVATMNMGLTMRSTASSVTFSTGHFKDSVNHGTDIGNLINGGILAIYMGMKGLGQIIKQTESHTSKGCPIAIMFDASCYNEEIIIDHLSTIEEQLAFQRLEDHLSICILGSILDDINRTLLSNNRNDKGNLYLIKGDKERATAKTETLYDEGIQCLIDFDHSYHTSQQNVYGEMIKHKSTKTVYV